MTANVGNQFAMEIINIYIWFFSYNFWEMETQVGKKFRVVLSLYKEMAGKIKHVIKEEM